MHLLLRRSQQDDGWVWSSRTFLLDARLDLDAEDLHLFEKYSLYGYVVYDSDARVQHAHSAYESFDAASKPMTPIPWEPSGGDLPTAFAEIGATTSTPVFDMFSAKDNTFNAFDCIQQKKIVLVNTNRFAIGDEGSAIFGRFVLAQCLSAALARASVPEQDRHLALCIVDEAKQYVDENTEKFLADARQFGLGLFLATQYAQQLPEGVRRAIYGNTSIKFIGPIEYADRVSLAREMNTTPEFIGAMRAYDRSHTEWAVHVRSSNFTPSAVKVTVPYGTLENEPMMDDEAYQRGANRASVPTKEEPAPNEPVVETAPLEGEPWAIKPGQDW